MMMRRISLIYTILLIAITAHAQQDVDFHLNAHLFSGQKILKVKRDFHDEYLWVLAENDHVYRVNSLTMAADDYTATLAPYSSLPFIDIMGYNSNTVFIASGETTVIELNKGSIRIISAADGLPGPVTSLGMDLGWNMDGGRTRDEILISTKGGMRTFNVKKQVLRTLADGGAWIGNSSIADSRIYESTYRTETSKDSTAAAVPDNAGTGTTRYLPIEFNTGDIYSNAGAFDLSYIWEDDKQFSSNINTALAVNNVVGFNIDGQFSTFFWGTENGMFQALTAFTYDASTCPWSQYLSGIKVNKITDIMGLTSFSIYYESALIKQNLLIGTNNGLYFSSSFYDPTGGYQGKVTLFHDDELGSTVINDICVNAVPDAQPICENGVWLAANDGLYLLKPDYGKYFNNQPQKLIAFANQPSTLSELQVCDQASATATIEGGSYNNIQWYKDGAELAGESKSSLTITAAGDYNAVIYDSCEGLHIESNHLKVTTISAPVFTFNYPDIIKQCDNTPYTLQTDDNPAYHYRWYTNGVLNGETSSAMAVTQTGKYKVEVSACTNSWVPSKEVEVDMISLPVPQIGTDKPIFCVVGVQALTVGVPVDPAYTINWYRDGNLLPADKNLITINETNPGAYTVVLSSNTSDCTQTSPPFQLTFTPAPVFTFDYPDEVQYCTGTPITLKATGSGTYQYRWYKDGVLTGDAGASLNVTAKGSFKVEVSSCTASWYPSKAVQVDFVTVTVPTITPDKPAYCLGDNASLQVNTTADIDQSISWYKDGVLLIANDNQSSILTNVPGSYTVTVTNNIVNTDGTKCSQTSAAQAVAFNPPPTVSIRQVVNTTICDGQTVTLAADHSSGATVKWSTGETGDQISVTAPGRYRATVTSASGCQADAATDVTFLPNPVFRVKDTSLCTFKKETVTLKAPSGFSQYAWNGQTGGQTYDVSSPQTVSLTVTDANGCQATQQIRVVDQCDNVYIPNAFTPNGDGINDTWVIQGLDPTGQVQVFTRYGALVFESKGYSTPWNGEYNGKKLPTGVYYYIVTAKNGAQKFSGALTIIY